MDEHCRDTVRAFLDRYCFPLFVADEEGRVRPLNRAAFARLDGPTRRRLTDLLGGNGRLASEPVRALLREAARAPVHACLARRFHLEGENRPLDVLVYGREGPHQGLLVMVLDPDSFRPPDPELLAGWFGLTRREAEVVAHLACGESLEEVAERLGITTGTARNHLKAAFHKTGISGQARLAAALAPVAPLLGSPAAGRAPGNTAAGEEKNAHPSRMGHAKGGGSGK